MRSTLQNSRSRFTHVGAVLFSTEKQFYCCPPFQAYDIQSTSTSYGFRGFSREWGFVTTDQLSVCQTLSRYLDACRGLPLGELRYSHNTQVSAVTGCNIHHLIRSGCQSKP